MRKESHKKEKKKEIRNLKQFPSLSFILSLYSDCIFLLFFLNIIFILFIMNERFEHNLQKIIQ